MLEQAYKNKAPHSRLMTTMAAGLDLKVYPSADVSYIVL